ncbi:hypothetical protein SLS62_007475 [Diatrype stigma]|uniref:Cytochrome P450 n=1 Tax=Diatrype stigma TaxID=117547 RepID=A0AAN9UN75_9PEZI
MDVSICIVIAAIESWAGARFGLLFGVQALCSPAIDCNSHATKKFFWLLLAVQYLSLKPNTHNHVQDNHPFLGQLPNSLRAESPVSLYTQWVREHPGAPLIRHLSFANAEVVVAASLAAQREILQTQCYAFRKSRLWTRLTRDISGDGISTLEGFAAHRAHRRVLAAPFAPANVRGRLGPVFREKAAEFCALLDGLLDGAGHEKGEGEGGRRGRTKTAVIRDCADLFSRATLDIVGIATLGVDMAYLGQAQRQVQTKSQSQSQSKSRPSLFAGVGTGEKGEYTFHEAYREIFTPDALGKLLLFLNAFLPTRWVPIPANRRFRAATTWLRRVLTERVRARRREMAAAVADGSYDGSASRDLLSFLLEESVLTGAAAAAPGRIGGQAGEDQLRAESAQLAARILEPTCADIDALPYMNVFLKEILRLYPPANAVHREAARDLTIEGVHIPKGTTFVIPLQCVGLNPAIWGEDADTFRPSRWVEERGEGKDPDDLAITMSDTKTSSTTQHSAAIASLSSFAFAAFSNGPRICPGKGFATYEIKAILFEVVQRYRFLAIEGNFSLENPSLNLHPRGMNIRFERLEVDT